MIAAVIVSLAALAAAVYVIAPLRRRALERDDTAADELEHALVRKRAALAEIIDLEAEHAAGKLADAELEHLRAEYEAEAMRAIAEVDVLQQARAHVDELEIEIARARQRIACPTCGTPREGTCPRCDA